MSSTGSPEEYQKSPVEEKPPKMPGQLCRICEDKAAGKYYGVIVCDGCKGFFRRSVRNSQVYYCRFERNCTVGKDNRNQCRYCRLRKCFRAGMKKEAVQYERDRIRGRKDSIDENSIAGGNNNGCALTLGSLIQADMLIRQPANYHPDTPIDLRTKSLATPNDFYDSTRDQTLVLVSWAKYIPAFCELPVDDKVALLRGHAGDNLVLGLARRSLDLKDTLLLGNGFVITRESEDILGVSTRIMDELIKPLSRINIDDTEFACLKAIIFFDPNAPGLSDPDKIYNLRHQAQILLEDYVADRQMESSTRGRFGELLLILPALRSITTGVQDEMQFRKLFGVARIDKIVRETMLRENLDSEVAEEVPSMTPPWIDPTTASVPLSAVSPGGSNNFLSDEDSQQTSCYDTISPSAVQPSANAQQPMYDGEEDDQGLTYQQEFGSFYSAHGYA